MATEKLLFGTKEWAPNNFNFMHGCSNDCVYCYAKEMAIRFKRKTSETWKDEQPASLDGRSYRKKHGSIMLPSSHDITPGSLDRTLQVMGKLLDNGNELLLVTKPHFSCVQQIVDTFEEKKHLIKFRFTIGSSDSKVLKLWEPGAPDFSQRLNSLQYAFEMGYSTSISCEPLLDDQFDRLYSEVRPWVSDSIWVGKMNMAAKRVRTNTAGIFSQSEVASLLATQTDEKILSLYERYHDNPMIEWKESIKKVVLEHGLISI
jgi:DNA repair photolyase